VMKNIQIQTLIIWQKCLWN